MKKMYKTLPILLMSLCPLISGCSPEESGSQCEIRFTLSYEGTLVNIGFAVIGDFCNWGEVNEELSDDAVILEMVDKDLYRGSKYFDKSSTIHYKLVQYGNNILDNRIIEIENVPDRIITIESGYTTINLRWGELN